MAALVNSEGITVIEYKVEVERFQASESARGKETPLEDASKIVLDDLINQVLLAQGATSAGFKLDEAALQTRIETLASQVGGQDKLAAWQAAHGYSNETFRTALERSLAAAWMRDQIIASVPSTTEQVHVQQILLYNEEKARSIKAQLDAGEDFGELAALYDPATRGDLGWFPRGYLFEAQIEDNAFSLQPGQYSDVIVSEVGFHIIKVLERGSQHSLSPDARRTLQDLALQGWLKEQREKSTIVLAP